jgi:hypothetical protein
MNVDDKLQATAALTPEMIEDFHCIREFVAPGLVWMLWRSEYT